MYERVKHIQHKIQHNRLLFVFLTLNIFAFCLRFPEVYLGLYERFMVELFAKIVDGF